jgi:protein-S-isoprenylcysteine O-methyltransferase Ste14
MTAYQRIFGSGPVLLALSLSLIVGAIYLQKLVNLPGLSLNWPLRGLLAAGVLAVGVSVALWAFRALPLVERGQHLVTSGPYRYVRHPLYSTVMLFGLAAFVVAQSYLVLGAVLLQYLAAHLIVGYEEGLMERQFGQAWREYTRRTPRFFPRPWRSGH